MQKFLRWCAVVLRHYVLLIGGAIAGALGVYVQQYVPGGAIPSSWFYGLCVIALVGALFATWRDEYDRATEATAELEGLKRSHARDVEWNRAIQTFQGLWDLEIEATLTKSTCNGATTEKWSFHVFRSTSDYDAHVRACETACRVAGHALGLSKTWRTLSADITARIDPLDRWLQFVAIKDGFDGMTGNGCDNTGPVRIDYVSEGIKDIHKKSKRLCEDCRNHELLP